MANEKHLLLTVGGDYVDSALVEEKWQVGVRLALTFGGADPVGTLPNNWNPTATTINRTETHWTITGNWLATGPSTIFHPDDYLHTKAAPAFATWLDAFPALSNQCRIKQLKLSPIGTDGRAIPAPPYSAGSPTILTYTSSYPVGSSAGSMLPLQNSLVMSHRTAQVGRRGRGRMFVPCLTTGLVDTHSHVASGVITSALAAQVALLHGLTVNGATSADPSVNAVVTGDPWTHYGLITQVRAGNVSDTQRRRRRSLTETVTSSSV